MGLVRIVSVVVAIVIVVSSLPISVYALTPKEQKGVKVLKAPGLEHESPTWLTPFSLEEAPEDIAYRTSILPYPEDRAERMYIVLPTLGIVAPVVFVPEWTTDYTMMSQWKEIDINKYLVEGVMHYPSTSMPWEEWNAVIFGHSNFFTAQPGKYKTIFADSMNLDVSPRDEIRIYTQQPDQTYDLQKFSVDESYETVPTDVEVLRPKWGKEITVFACTNGLEWRRILRGTLIENDEILIPYAMKFRVEDALARLKIATEGKKQDVRSLMLMEIEEINAGMTTAVSYDDKFKQYILKYLEKKLLSV